MHCTKPFFFISKHLPRLGELGINGTELKKINTAIKSYSKEAECECHYSLHDVRFIMFGGIFNV